MTTLLDYYNEDGTPWFARCILAYIQGQDNDILRGSWNNESDEYEASLGLTRYRNGREQGYVFSIKYRGRQKNYAVFCPCQYDGICLETFEQVSDFPWPWDLKEWKKSGPFEHEYDLEDVIKCAKFIEYDMMDWVYNIKHS